MSIFKSYFKKDNTLIESNLRNVSLNPVTEISFGTFNKQVSRYIFDVDLTNFQNRIANGLINPNRIISHTLHMTNTIAYAPEYIGKKSYDYTIQRASSFTLDLFNITEDWTDGSGYDFLYGDFMQKIQSPNWETNSTGTNWTVHGAYISGTSEIINSQSFEAGNEDIVIDITNYINQRLFGTGYTGTTAFTGNTYGLGIKFTDSIEDLETVHREAVAFHTRHTNTYYEPYIETIVDDTILDDRNYFFMDKDNDLYLYSNIGNSLQDVIINKVDVYDYENNLVETLTGSSIIHVSKGIYKITLNIDSQTIPDAVIFRDVWSITVNGKTYSQSNQFYLISQYKYHNYNLSNQIDFRNYAFYFWGIGEREKIKAGDVRKLKLTIKEYYPNQNNFLPLDIQYRLFTTVGADYQIDVIPYTSFNRTMNGFEVDIDTSWLIPQDYHLQIRLKNGNYFENKETLMFTVVSEDIK